jgi:erythromycin esterase
MADNVQWAVENEGPKGRVLVFAHNGHVNNAQDWTPEKPFWMGGHLRRTYGKRLLIIATSSATTSGGLETHEPLEADTIDATLAHIGPKFFLDLRTARQDPAALAWLSTERRLHQNIINHMRITPSTAVDAFVFLGGLTPAGEQNRDDSPLE